MKQFKTKGLSILYGFGMVLLFWWLLYILLDTPAIPNPGATITQTLKIFPNQLAYHLWVSLKRIGCAILFAALVGTTLGITMGLNQRFDQALSPIVYILYPLPKIAFLPIFMILFGLNELPKIILIFVVIVFQFILSAKDAVKEIPVSWFDSFQSLGLQKRDALKHLIIPAILPQWFTALRSSVGVSIAVLFFAENFATSYGIGYYIMNAWAMANYVNMFCGITALGVLGLLIFMVIDCIEAKVCHWKTIETKMKRESIQA
ncbi:ABC transporter permease [Erysipelothrix inopinata]|uniref:ABC transporter permease n=1 Tax=Erysipelothrix inopinata TaxID=225084 RepID=A0A7G9RWK4_9FIRM|nr:ABC transporter permease [Erysipelothrix inopinata]QNN59979.1 ABC transporter permease [Erysipelothrix inopinata]